MEDIVKALNNFVEVNYGVSGRFIQTKSCVTDTKFKAYKHYKLCLYYTNNGNNTLIIEESITVKENTGDDLTKYLNIKFLEALFDYVASDEFRDLMNGTIDI